MSGSRRDRLVALTAAFAALLACGYLVRQASGERHLKRANELALAGDFRAAIAEAREADAGSTRPRALRVVAYSYFKLGDAERFLPAARRALREAPSDWELRRDYALVVALRGNRVTSRKQMNLALAANPKLELPFGFVRATSGQRP